MARTFGPSSPHAVRIVYRFGAVDAQDPETLVLGVVVVVLIPAP